MNQNLSQLLKTVRTQMKMSQARLADKLKRDTQLVTRIESGVRKKNEDIIEPLFNVVAKTLGASQAKKIFGSMAPVLKTATRKAARTAAGTEVRKTKARKATGTSARRMATRKASSPIGTRTTATRRKTTSQTD